MLQINLFTLINAISNCTIALSAMGLLIHIFGDPDNSIWNNKLQAWLAKFGLSVIICGAVSNVLTLNTPAKTEIILNCGMSITFFWLSLWQYEQFTEKVKQSKKTTPVKRKKPAVKTTVRSSKAKKTS
jgi:hypothetical protein